jgi:hypothetical protein
MDHFLSGAVAAASVAVGIFFLKFWRHTRDRFFLYFAWSFWIEAMNRMALAVIQESSEASPATYGVRLVSYALIIWAIWEKNRPGDPTRLPPAP